MYPTSDLGARVRGTRQMWCRRGCRVLAAGLAGVLVWWSQREPRYRGLPVSRWLDCCDATLSGQLPTPGWEETRTAIRHFGPVAISYYTKRLAYEPPGWQLRVLAALHQAPPGAAASISEKLQERIDIRIERRSKAASAFLYLGSNAAGAVPDLERMAADPNYPGRALRAIEALSAVGPAGAPALTRLGIGQKYNADQYYDAMLVALQDSARYSNAVVRRKALDAIATTRDSQTEFILKSLLQDPNLAVRCDTTNALIKSHLFGKGFEGGVMRKRSN